VEEQGLNSSPYLELCKMIPDFSSEKTLRELPRATFLQNVSDILYIVEQRLNGHTSIRAVQSIIGIRNNLCCLLWTLPEAPSACPAPGSRGTLSIPTHPPFPWKMEMCKILWGYQRFMQAVERVLETWPPSPGHSHRDRRSLLRALLEQRRRGRAG
ncbi:oncostatin-M, partial [Gracilinanus agilis]|uniref:oncostatin-M n=1 Tax=Gracilinanus agilis TaxID=191870 RepID=UPI001CFD5B04